MRIYPVFLALIVASIGMAHAGILDGQIEEQTGQGAFVILDPSEEFTVGYDNFDDDNLYAFNEDQNIVLIEPVRVDIGGRNGMISSGTMVASHYVFFDSLNGFHVGSVYFDAPILGIAAYQDTLANTDFLANTNVQYVSPNLRGLEEGDHAWIDPNDPHRLWVAWAGSSPGDYIRVFTARSPGV